MPAGVHARQASRIMRFGSQQSRGAHALFRAHEFRFARTDVRQAHFGGVEDSTHLQRGLGHHGLEAIAVHRFDERRQLHGDALRFVDIATIERVGEVTHRAGGGVRDHGDDADCADIGGIGFLTWDDIYTNKMKFKRYRMQSKIILVTTACLILIPIIFFFTCDLKNLSAGNRLLAAAFQSVTTRTAGFNTIDISKMSEASKAVMILLMLIGGSPGSTAGGMKTTTFTVLLLNAIATFRSQENAGAFGRRLEYHVIKNAATIAILYFTLFFCGGLAISVYEELPLLDCLYEAASAVGTVGLTLGITPKLHMFSQIVLIILMYLGRVGGLTLIYAVLSRRNRGNAKLPLEKITVG